MLFFNDLCSVREQVSPPEDNYRARCWCNQSVIVALRGRIVVVVWAKNSNLWNTICGTMHATVPYTCNNGIACILLELQTL